MKFNRRHPLVSAWASYEEMVARFADGDGVSPIEAQRRAFFGGVAVALLGLSRAIGAAITEAEGDALLEAALEDLDAEQRRMFSAFIGDIELTAHEPVEH